MTVVNKILLKNIKNIFLSAVFFFLAECILNIHISNATTFFCFDGSFLEKMNTHVKSLGGKIYACFSCGSFCNTVENCCIDVLKENINNMSFDVQATKSNEKEGDEELTFKIEDALTLYFVPSFQSHLLDPINKSLEIVEISLKNDESSQKKVLNFKINLTQMMRSSKNVKILSSVVTPLLPNGSPTPFQSKVVAGKMIVFQISHNVTFYFQWDTADPFFGLSIVLNVLDTPGEWMSNIKSDGFEDFAVNNVNISAGIFFGKEKATSGFAFFVELSNLFKAEEIKNLFSNYQSSPPVSGTLKTMPSKHQNRSLKKSTSVVSPASFHKKSKDLYTVSSIGQ